MSDEKLLEGKEKRDERGGSDSFSGRRKLFWGNDDHLKSRAALSFQLEFSPYCSLESGG